MKKIIFPIIVLAVLGAGFYLISPLWRVVEVNEALPSVQSTSETTASEEPEVLREGTFTGFDDIHTGSGTARILSIGDKTYLRFEENFFVNNGPDLYVGFGKDGKYVKGSEISRLKGTQGSQNYELPQGFDLDAYNEVYVWCKAFSVPFTKAVLE
jgi:hypothetical protein